MLVLESRGVVAGIYDIVIGASVSHVFKLDCNINQIKQVALMKEPQNMEQFRDFCKVLKYKINRQKIEIEDLKDKNRKLQAQIVELKSAPPPPAIPPPLQSLRGGRKNTDNSTPGTPVKRVNSIPSQILDRPQINASSLKGKNKVMKVLKDGCEAMGITPQSIFRIADLHNKMEVEYDHFRNTLSKLSLGLNPKEISTLIYMFDENCNSFISQSQFIETLQGYQIAQEQIENSKIYKHICLEKLASMLSDAHINTSAFYADMNPKKDGIVDMDSFQQHIKKVLQGKIYEKQIAGAFYAMDLQRNGNIDKQNFVYGINSTIRKLQTMGPSRKVESIIKQNQNNATPGTTGMQNSKNMDGIIGRAFDQLKSPKNPNNQSRISYDQNQNQQSAIIIKVPLESLSPQEVLHRLKQESGVSLLNFYQELCRVPMDRRTTLFNFKKVFANLTKGQKAEVEVVSSLFKLIDFQQKGSLHFSELLYFYLAQSNDVSMIFRLLGKYFFNNDLNCERFWFLFGINPDSDISKHRFIEVMAKTFEGPEGAQKLWEKLWSYFDKGRGVLPITVLSKQMAKYQIIETNSS